VGSSGQWAVGSREYQCPRARGFESRAFFLCFLIWEGRRKEDFFWLGRGYPAPACSGGNSLLIGIANPALKNIRWRAIINSIQNSSQLDFCMQTGYFSKAKSRAKPTTRKSTIQRSMGLYRKQETVIAPFFFARKRAGGFFFAWKGLPC
jgi:hypothetical protein